MKLCLLAIRQEYVPVDKLNEDDHGGVESLEIRGDPKLYL